jgi:hypothetical protein
VRQKARSRPKTQKKVDSEKKKVLSAGTTRPPRKPALERQRAIKTRAVAPVAAVSSGSSSLLLPLALGAALGLSLLVAVLALTPLWALPRPVAALVYDRREVLIFWGLATALGVGLALTLALA